MPDAPIFLIAVLAAIFLVVSFVIRTWWRGVKLSLFIFAIVLFALAFFAYVAQHR
jgi:Na+/H+ antiporter NhaC